MSSFDVATATSAQRSAYTTGALAGQSRSKYAPPSEDELRAAYTAGYERNGGKLPKAAAPKPAPVRKPTRVVDDGIEMERLMGNAVWRAKMRHFSKVFARLLAEVPAGKKVRVRAAWEWAAATYTGPDDDSGLYSWNNNRVPDVSLWLIIVRPELRGRIEFRGGVDPAWLDASEPPVNPWVRWFDPETPFYPKYVRPLRAPLPEGLQRGSVDEFVREMGWNTY